MVEMDSSIEPRAAVEQFRAVIDDWDQYGDNILALRAARDVHVQVVWSLRKVIGLEAASKISLCAFNEAWKQSCDEKKEFADPFSFPEGDRGRSICCKRLRTR